MGNASLAREILVSRYFKKGLTLIEILVVIAILALLIVVLLPSLRRAKEQAVRVVCGSNLHQIYSASAAYASENKGYFPYRTPNSHWLPHQMRLYSHDLNEFFIKPYMGPTKEKIMFCPGKIDKYREFVNSPVMVDRGYVVTYQYFNLYESTNWKIEYVNLECSTKLKSNYPIWGCLTADTDISPTSIDFLSHDLGKAPLMPKGMNSAALSGDVRWYKTKQLEHYFTDSNGWDYYWPNSR